MSSNRLTATIVGVLYITGTVAGVLSVVVTSPLFNDPDYMNKITANENQIIAGALFVLLMGFALAMVPAMMFPIFRKYNEALAVGYVIFRGALETVIYIISALCWLFLLLVSQKYVSAGTAQAGYYQAIGSVLFAGNNVISTILVITFSLDALMIYTLFYQSNLIPRWISIWGFIAILMHFSTAFLALFGHISSTVSPITTAINLPIFLQEMVMAVWLIAKGFRKSSVESKAGSPSVFSTVMD